MVVILDYDAHKVGFQPIEESRQRNQRDLVSNQDPLLEETLDERSPLCAARPVCIGDQLLVLMENQCNDPPCDLYFFREVDDVTKTCIYTVGFQLLVFLPLCMCVCSDMVLYYFSVKLTRKIKAQAKKKNI